MGVPVCNSNLLAINFSYSILFTPSSPLIQGHEMAEMGRCYCAERNSYLFHCSCFILIHYFGLITVLLVQIKVTTIFGTFFFINITPQNM